MMSNLKTFSASLSNMGRKRQNNEDFLTYYEPEDPKEYFQSGSLYIVADGVGGAAKGERASRYAADKVMYDYYQTPDLAPGERLRHLMREAGNQIYQYADGEGFGRMATTMVAAVVRNDTLLVAHVGDSRVYLIRGAQVTQLTRDHSLVGEMIRDGSLTEEESLHSKVKNRLTRSLGGEENVPVDVTNEIPLEPGDRILLCTDGLTRYALPRDLLEMVPGRNPAQAVQLLIDFANRQGGADNVTAIVISVHDKDEKVAWASAAFHPITAPIPWDDRETDPSTIPHVRSSSPRGPRPWRETLPAWLSISGAVVLAVLVIGVIAASFSWITFPAALVETETPTVQVNPIVSTPTPHPLTATQPLPSQTATFISPTVTVDPNLGLLDRAKFIIDKTVEDSSKFPPGTKFKKTWTIQNTGTSTWTTAYKLVFLDGDQMSGPAEVSMPSNVSPNEMVDISVDLISPVADGPYQGNWMLKNASGASFQKIYVMIIVSNSAATPTPPQN